MVSAPMRVFVVDDDADTTECMSLLLKHHGHEVRVANRGWAAIEQAPVFRPDVMLVDLAMPQCDGLTVARRVRQMPDLLGVSLVAVTGYGDSLHRQQALDAGFDECVIKPLPLDALLEVLVRVRQRVAASRQRVSQAAEVAAEGLRRAKASREAPDASLEQPLAGDLSPIVLNIRKSGISDIISLKDQAVAEQLHGWLRARGCRVGPVFHISPGHPAFFVYSRRQLRALLAAHPRFEIKDG